MGHSVAFKLNKPANQFQAGDSTGFGIRGGVKFYNRKTKKDEYTNYEAVVFAKTAAHIEYYSSSLIEGAVVMVSGDTIGVNTFDGNQGLQITLALNNARLDYIASPSQVRAPDAAQQAHNKAIPQHQAQQAPAGFDGFEDETLPF